MEETENKVKHVIKQVRGGSRVGGSPRHPLGIPVLEEGFPMWQRVPLCRQSQRQIQSRVDMGWPEAPRASRHTWLSRLAGVGRCPFLLQQPRQPHLPLIQHVLPAGLISFSLPPTLRSRNRGPHSTAKGREAWRGCRLANVAQVPRAFEFRLTSPGSPFYQRRARTGVEEGRAGACPRSHKAKGRTSGPGPFHYLLTKAGMAGWGTDLRGESALCV